MHRLVSRTGFINLKLSAYEYFATQHGNNIYLLKGILTARSLVRICAQPMSPNKDETRLVLILAVGTQLNLTNKYYFRAVWQNIHYNSIPWPGKMPQKNIEINSVSKRC